jgi:hypothetical protein
MSEDEPPNQESFDRLLAWLDPDREQAGIELNEIYIRLVKIFAYRGCLIAEELADKVINRVARKLPEVEDHYVGDHRRYFGGFIKGVYHEYLRDLEKQKRLPPPPPDPPDEKIFQCLEECLNKLALEDRQFIITYYTDQGRAKIENRKALAEKFAVTLNTLRTRAHRLKTSVKECVLRCLKEGET